MGAKEGAGPDSDGPLEIPQRFEHSKAIPRFPSLERSIEGGPSAMVEAATPMKTMVENWPEFRGGSLSSRGTASIEGTIDPNQIDTRPTQAEDTLRSSVIGNNRPTTPVS